MARWLTDLVRDATFAARTIRKQPGFAAVAILSAALGIGEASFGEGIRDEKASHGADDSASRSATGNRVFALASARGLDSSQRSMRA